MIAIPAPPHYVFGTDNDMGRMLNERTNSSSVTDESSVSPASTAHAVAALC